VKGVLCFNGLVGRARRTRSPAKPHTSHRGFPSPPPASVPGRCRAKMAFTAPHFSRIAV